MIWVFFLKNDLGLLLVLQHPVTGKKTDTVCSSRLSLRYARLVLKVFVLRQWFSLRKLWLFKGKKGEILVTILHWKIEFEGQ